ncbi:uncharacterized protein LOC105281599 isoform X2 [Ooceraea biroi]|nr:uncharacterized protein LOC105281599 isoform X2 [Ooceraea biroi]
MYGAFILLSILAIRINGFTLDDVQCNYVFKQKCHADINNYNIVQYNSSVINYCTTEDVPNEIDFTIIEDENDGYLKVEFTPPKRECRYGVALLVNPSIKDERECREYKFEKANNINSTVHTTEKTLCVLTNNQLIRYNDNSTVSLCKDNIEQWYQYIFTGCYALRFHVGRQNYLIRGHTLLNTIYCPKQVMEPQFICKYNTHSYPDERHELTNFTLNTSLPSDTGLLLKVALISEHNRSLENPCVWKSDDEKSPIYTRTVNLVKKKDRNCTVKWVQTARGEHVKTVQCNFQVQTVQGADYCFVFRVIDDRCHMNTFWTPPNINGMMPCTWIKRCARAFENATRVENTNTISSDRLLSANSYLLLPIIAVVLLVSTIVGTLCFLHYLRIRKEEMNLYVNPQHDDFMNPACLKPADFIVGNNGSEKRIYHDNFTCDDIILLYTKTSTSFAALMKDFRETLAKICSCYVHDWHDGAEWNDVAKVGAVLWFTELLNCGCRVVWIDTPATRSVVTSNPRENDSDLKKLNKYYEIGDFRDVALPVVLDLAKRNTKDAVRQYRRHFIV